MADSAATLISDDDDAQRELSEQGAMRYPLTNFLYAIRCG